MLQRRFAIAGLSGLAALALALGCSSSGGGGAGGASAKSGVLLAVRFPDPSAQSPGPDLNHPPTNASLVQQIVLFFDQSPSAGEVNSRTIPVQDGQGFPVPGSYSVSGTTVIFTPALPTEPLVWVSPTSFDTGGAGMMPDSDYSVRVGPTTWSWVASVNPDLVAAYPDQADPRGTRMFFHTTADPTLFFTGLQDVSPQLVSSDPADGETGVSPNLYTDPEGLFPPRRKYTLTFDAAVNPSELNVGDRTFRVIDLDDRPASHPTGLPLGSSVRVLENEVDRAVVEVAPSGILPFAHLLSLEYPRDLKGLSQGEIAGVTPEVAATFTVADLPVGHTGTVYDVLYEDFDTTERRADVTELELGTIPAAWDRLDSTILQATAAFEGAGELGRFIPAPPPEGETKVLVLDTSSTVFPLFDGSTPDAPPGYEVQGGVFPFSEIDIPEGVIIQAQGLNPLVLLATGTVRLAGEIRALATDGIDESSYDSAVTSTPGGNPGAGGGRGGVGHPIVYWPPDQISVLSLVTPLRGGPGWGAGNLTPAGGQGGESGILDSRPVNKNFELDKSCGELTDDHGNGTRVPGGGGGSFLEEGTKGFDGIGNVRPDGMGGFVIPNRERPIDEFYGGQPGPWPFGDGNPDNDFIGIAGELKTIIGGQGGGAGGSRMEAYFCGNDCKFNASTKDDNRCLGGEFPLQNPSGQTFAASVGDGKGGGGGGGGGAVAIRALGYVTVEATGRVLCRGGNGGGGETLGCSNWAGSGAGGSGGAIILESAEGIHLLEGSLLDVQGGAGNRATPDDLRYTSCNLRDGNLGQGGNGSPGIIQLQVPFGQEAVVDKRKSTNPSRSWVDKKNTLNPASFTATSVALSTWFDMGRVIEREPAGASPLFRFHIAGREVGFTDDGFVETDAEGFVIDPAGTDVVCDYLGQIDPLTGKYVPGQEPREDFIPQNATVRVEFQGANAIEEGSKEVDPATVTVWAPTPGVANGRQFLRYRIVFDIAAADGVDLEPNLPLPSSQSIGISAEF